MRRVRALDGAEAGDDGHERWRHRRFASAKSIRVDGGVNPLRDELQSLAGEVIVEKFERRIPQQLVLQDRGAGARRKPDHIARPARRWRRRRFHRLATKTKESEDAAHDGRGGLHQLPAVQGKPFVILTRTIRARLSCHGTPPASCHVWTDVITEYET